MVRKFISLALLVLLFSGCEKDWNALDEWQELYVVYGTLNLKDTAQYIRINKVFATSGDPALMAPVADCVNINPQHFEITLQRFQDDAAVDPPIALYPSTDYEKEEGLFSSSGYYTFKTNQRLQIDSRYTLRVRNTQTGYVMTATTPTFGRRTLHQSFLEKRYFNITQYKPESIDYAGSLMPNQFEKRIQRLLYLELTDTDTTEKILDWRPWLYAYKGSAEDSSQQFIDDYFAFIATHIPFKPGVKRIAIGVDKLLILNDEELELFMEVSSTAGSLHYNPDYTNFDRGAGFIGCRYYYTYFAMDLKDETLDSLSYGRFTHALNFADAQGNWH